MYQTDLKEFDNIKFDLYIGYGITKTIYGKVLNIVRCMGQILSIQIKGTNGKIYNKIPFSDIVKV